MSEIPVRFLVTIHALWTVPTLLLLFKLVNSPYVFCWLLLNNNTSVSWGAFLNWWGVLKLFTMKRIQWSSTTVVFLRLPGRFSFLPNTPVCSFHLGMKGQVLRALDYICCRSANPITSGVFFPPFLFFPFTVEKEHNLYSDWITLSQLQIVIYLSSSTRWSNMAPRQTR